MNIDTTNQHSFVNITYEQNGRSSATDAMGMREMQAMAYAHRDKRFLLIKAPPASGKSRALMFIALDKLANQGVKKVVVAVPEMTIGRSFRNTNLTQHGFFADWKVTPYYDLCAAGCKDADKAKRFCEFMDKADKSQILVCAHATLQNAMKMLDDEAWNDCLLAVDEFHHASADAYNGLGDTVRRVMNNSTGHIVAMTGSYFRGDGIPVLRPEDEARFHPVTFDYYQQLNGYKYLKHLILGYHFYKGVYLDHLTEALDTRRKTIIHIPHVNSRASTGNKYNEVAEIMQLIGREVHHDYNTGVYTLETPDGRRLKVTDLVEDDKATRDRVQGYLQRMNKRDDMDIIIALGTAKEGFDWEWCECCLTIGVRGSLTEVVQIIGRCTRDCEGKESARFINMIAMPDADLPEVKVAVNDFMKAITVSLLMEQVMAPRWNFRTTKEATGDPTGNTVVVEGLKPLSSARTRQITEEQLVDLKASILQNPGVVQAIGGESTAERITLDLIPKVIRERYPDLNKDEVEEVRQRVLLDMIVKGSEITVEGEGSETETTDDEKPADGERLLKLRNALRVEHLHINLIDKINPFRRAYEMVSKSLDAPTLRVIQDTLAEQKYEISEEVAKRLFQEPLHEWIAEHDGKLPSRNASNGKERELAQALAYMRNQKLRYMMGLEYQDENEK